MNNIIKSIEKQVRKAQDNCDAAIIHAVNQAEYEADKQAEVLIAIDGIISIMSMSCDNSAMVESLKGLVSIELAFNDENSAAKLNAQTDIRMNLDRDLDALKEQISYMKDMVS
jgi:hypothetical protein